MPTNPVLGVDIGTQSLRAALYAPNGARLAQALSPYATERPRVNWAEQRPGDWWTALCHAVPLCLERAGVTGQEVAAVGLDGTSYTGVFCREDGTPLRPALLWMDLRAAEEAKAVEATGHEALATCNYKVAPEWLLPKALWVKNHEPKVYDATDRFIEGVDWVVHRLTGRWATSNSNASGKRHWSPETGWPESLYAQAGLEKVIAGSPDDIVYLGRPIGPLRPEAAEALGLSTDCVVAHGGMDGWTAYAGVNAFAAGASTLNLGTSNVLAVESAAPRHIDGVMGPFPDGLRRGVYAYEGGQTSGAAIIGWALSLLGRDDSPGSHARLEEQAAKLPPGAEGLVAFDAWRGNRNPYYDPQARGVLCGLTLEHGPAHFYRAVLEGCAFGIKNVASIFECGGVRIDEMRACGSGANNRLWVQILASVTGKPVLVSSEKDATCLGSAMCAAVAAGLHSSLEEAAAAMQPDFERVEPEAERRVYDELFRSYLSIYKNMKGDMHALARISEGSV